MDESRADLLQHRIELYRATLRAGARGRVAIEYLRQIESDEAELSQIRRAQESHLTSRGLSADQRPIRSLAKYVTELTDHRRAGLAARIRRIEKEIARRRSHHHHHHFHR
jgi:hypothetical protein